MYKISKSVFDLIIQNKMYNLLLLIEMETIQKHMDLEIIRFKNSLKRFMFHFVSLLSF